MKNRKNLEEFISKISHNGMSAKYQKLLPVILENYFDGKPLEETRERFKEKNRGLVNRTYDLMENLKIYSLQKISSASLFLMRNPRETVKLGDSFFVAAIFEAMKNYPSLKKEIPKFSKKYKLNGFLNDFFDIQNYKKKEEIIKEHSKELTEVTKDPEFYVLVMDNFWNSVH